MGGRRAALLASLVVTAAFAANAGADPFLPPGLTGPLPMPNGPATATQSVSVPTPRARLQRPGAYRRTRRLPRGRTVRGALRRALLVGALDRERYKVHRRAWWHAQRAARRLNGRRRQELVAVLRTARRMAGAGLLTTSRVEAVMLTVRRNREFWLRHPPPAGGSRHRFRGDPFVYQYYPGQGLQLQPLANFGRANALWRTCTRAAHRRGWHCRKRTLRKLLDRLLALASRRDGYLAFEYLFSFGGGRPPWVSGMTQGTAAQALSRAARVLHDQRYRRAALDALGAFERRPPTGVAVRVTGGRHYLMYSFDPRVRILNGFLQAVRGLHDVAALTGNRRARRLFLRGDRVARRTIPAYDTGAWSLYERDGAEASLHYHRLTRDFARGLCRVTHEAPYCRADRRFSRYLVEPPRVQLAISGLTQPPRAGRALAVDVTVSKASTLQISARRRGALVLARRVTVPRGTYALTWTPRRAGRHAIAVLAVAVNGRRAAEALPVAVKPRPHKRARHRRSRALIARR